MSMYGVNASIPKTLVRGILESYAQHHNELRETLLDICDTPVSPELLPPNEDGTIKQKTEDKIGSYVIHDFILYYMQRHGFGPRKIFDLYILFSYDVLDNGIIYFIKRKKKSRL